MSKDISIQNKEVSISSLEIAEMTGKRHDNIIRDIESQLSEVSDLLRFEGIYKDRANREKRCYNLPRREALILVSGYDATLRAKIIDRLEELEKSLNQNIIALPNFNDPVESARAWADAVEKKQIAYKELEEQRPLVSFAKSVEASVNTILIREWVKTISQSEGVKIGQNKAYRWLRDNKYLMKNNEPYQKYIDNGYFEVTVTLVATPHGTKENLTTKITGKGQVALAGKISEGFRNEY